MFFVFIKEFIMKKLLAILALTLPMTALANGNLPFVGEKSFDFGGVPAYHTVYFLSIRKDRTMTLEEMTCSSIKCGPVITLYKGKFKSLIKLNRRSVHAGDYIQLNKNQAKLLNKNKKLKYGCDEVATAIPDNPCIGKYRNIW